MSVAERPNKLLKGATGDWEVVVGMEVHAQVTSKAKLFSGASTAFGNPPNSQVSLVDAAMPGMLPVINEECVRQAIRTGLGLKARIHLKSVFDRKNYFYPDLPQGYQISQEIVSKPDLRSAEEARAYLAKLRAILRYLGTCDGDMEKGSLRADVNVSVRRQGEPLGTRCEIKNVNSIRFIGQAIEYEARRQIGILEDGGRIEQETRLFDPGKGETRSMRNKEEAHDYRYFPDPDLLPLELTAEYVEALAGDLPELPDEKKARFIRDYGLSPYDAAVLVGERTTADFYEAVAKGRDAKTAANWVINELFGRLNKEGKGIEQSPISADQLGDILDLIAARVISGKIAKDLFEIVWSEGGDPWNIVETRGLKQVTDVSAIEKIIDEIIAANPDKLALEQLVGQVMRASAGKANPQAVNELLKRKLGI